MKRFSRIILLPIIVLSLSSCSSNNHVCKFTKFVDYDDSMHYKICSSNASHVEKGFHSYDKPEITLAPTDIKNGMQVYTCKMCKHKKYEIVPATGDYDFSESVVDEKYLKERFSSASAIYYKSTKDGKFGNDSYVFEHTTLPFDDEGNEYLFDLDYIQGTGSQYIDTGVKLTPGMSIEYRGVFTSRLPIVFSADESNRFYLLPDYSGKWEFSNSDETRFYGENAALSTPYAITIDLNDQTTFSINNITTYKVSTSLSLPDSSLQIFGDCSLISKSPSTRSIGKLYSLKIYDQSHKLIHDYVPCQNTKTSAVGLFDLIDNTFLANQGSGVFSYGKVINHSFDTIEVVKEATYKEAGLTRVKCSRCGKFYEIIYPATSYKLQYEVDTGVDYIKTFYDNDPNHFTKELLAYSRNRNSYNYSRYNAAINFEVVLKDGYKIDEIIVPSSSFEYKETSEKHYIAYNFTKDSNVIQIKTIRK